MKRPLVSPDSMDAFMPICQTTTEEIKLNQQPNTDFPYVGAAGEFPDEEEFLGAAGAGGEKKRRLTVGQVKALEKNFEIEKKPEPERKLELARELGLQPRQVAVWFQNRRARWKTKLLERDYGTLKSQHDSLKFAHDELSRQNQALFQEIQELKAKLKEEEITVSINISEVKQEEAENASSAERLIPPPPPPLPPSDLDYAAFDIFPDSLGDAGLSDSDSSAVLNDGSPTPAVITTSGCFLGQLLKVEEIGKLFDDHDEQWYCSMT